jgi:O-6-methylguanine DNA methyltransferase
MGYFSKHQIYFLHCINFCLVILYTKYVETPVGSMFAAANEQGVFMFDFVDRKGGLDKVKQRIAKSWKAVFVEKKHPSINVVEQQVAEYFDSKRQEFDFRLMFSGTAFQQEVFAALAQIPFGQTISYQQLAKQMNCPLAIRAIAHANGANCLAILVPCHRVIASNGLLTGYSGGIEAKKWLLDFEGGRPNAPVQSSLF